VPYGTAACARRFRSWTGLDAGSIRHRGRRGLVGGVGMRTPAKHTCGRHFQLDDLQRVPGITRGLSKWVVGSIPAGRGAGTSAHLKIRRSPALMRRAVTPRVRPCDSGRPRVFTFGYHQPYCFATQSSHSIVEPGSLRSGTVIRTGSRIRTAAMQWTT